jgi:hypothetical protein
LKTARGKWHRIKSSRFDGPLRGLSIVVTDIYHGVQVSDPLRALGGALESAACAAPATANAAAITANVAAAAKPRVLSINIQHTRRLPVGA